MVRVGHRVARDVPGFFPFQAVHVHEQAHELRDRDRGMRVVELETVLVRERRKVVAVARAPLADHVLQAGRCEEVLLAQAQLLSVLGCGVRVQHHRDVLGLVLRRYRVGITAGVEFLEVELIQRRCRPQA